jgi:hypothetical protein
MKIRRRARWQKDELTPDDRRFISRFEVTFFLVMTIVIAFSIGIVAALMKLLGQ